MAVLEHFEMHMGTGGSTRTAHASDHLPLLHNVACGNQQFVVMPVPRDVSGAVIDFARSEIGGLRVTIRFPASFRAA